MEEKHLFGKIQVITTDLFPELVPYIESGKVLASLYQRPFAQGKTAFELLLSYLLHGATPEPLTRLAPHIVLRSNLALFTSRKDYPGNATEPKRDSSPVYSAG
jgi:LacI family transcriptional regulator